MAIAFDANTSINTFTTTASTTHTPVGVPGLAVVVITQEVSAADRISGVTYDGVAMKRANFAANFSAEPGAAYIYWLGQPNPGAVTVTITVSAGTEAKGIFIGTFTTANVPIKLMSWAQVCAHDGSVATFTNPTSTLGTLSDFNGVVINGVFSGLAAPTSLTPLNSATLFAGAQAGGYDFGTDCAAASWNLQSGANVTTGWTAAIDDIAMVSAAFEEDQGAWFTP